MELLTSIVIAVAILVAFDLVAARFGVDSRDRIGDDRIVSTPHWL